MHLLVNGDGDLFRYDDPLPTGIYHLVLRGQLVEVDETSINAATVEWAKQQVADRTAAYRGEG